MNLKLRLPLAFSGMLAALMVAALVGIYGLNQSITTYDTEVAANQAHERAIAGLLAAFKTQVQEWKDTLLRAKDPAELDKHWTAFAKQESAVDENARVLLATLPAGESRRLVEQFAAAHVKMGEGYRNAFDAFKKAGFDPAVGDAAVAGVDREPARLLAESGRKIAADNAIASTRATVDVRRATIVSIVLLFAGALVVGVFGLRLGNAIASRLSRLQAGVNQMATGLYDTRLDVDGTDEIGTLQGAFNRMAGELQDNHGRITTDMEREKVATQQIEHLAYYDKLTDLPNRSLFSRLLERGIADALDRRRHLAVMFIDLDRFKNINDTLGHNAGDSLLKEVAARTKAMLREPDVVCRLGGDEFVVLLNGLDDPEAIAAIAHKILGAISASYRFMDHEFRVTASIGISVFPTDGSDEASLMKHADIAMYQAKQDGKNTFAFYADDLNTHSVERLAFESSLRHALDERRFEIHYQPKVTCVGGRMTGVEGLLRWHHPDLGLVPPNKFIPIAEETGLIVAIGRWVLETACRQQVEWRRRGIADLTMAVNISGRQFADEHLLVDVDAVLASTGIDPAMLEIEITESVLMRDIGKGAEVLAAFRKRGIRISIDDFGTGYSSLSTLKRFPIDSLKVDRSFVRELAVCSEDRAIADAIIAMGSTLGLTIIAEGVETAAQVAFLREHGCNEMQGFFFSRAIPANAIEALLASQPTGVLEGVDLTPSEHRQAADSAFVAFT